MSQHTPVAGKAALSSTIIVWIYAFLPANLIPSIIGRLVTDFEMDITTAGFLATGMTLINSATVLLLRPLVRRGYRVSLATIGTLILMTVAILGMLMPSAAMISVLLLVAGVGTGMALATASASISAVAQPDRAATISMIFNRLVVAIAYFAVPLIGTSLQSVLLILAIPGVVVLLTVRWLPSAPQNDVASEPEAKLAGAGSLAWILALGMGLLAITDDGIIGMSEIVAINAFGDGGSSLMLNLYAASTLAGLVGALGAGVISRKLGLVGALALSLGASFVGKGLLLVVPNTAVYGVGYMLWGFAFGLCLPLIFGLAASMRRDGSASVAVNGVYMLGVALGPTVAAQILDFSAIPGLAVVMAVVGIVASAIILVTAQRVSRAAAAAAVSTPERVSA